MLPAEHGFRQGCVEKALFQEKSDHSAPPKFLKRFAGPDRDEEEAVMAVKTALEDNGMNYRNNEEY